MARTIRRLLVLPALAGLALALGSDAALAVSAEDGKAIFEQKCTSCHTIGGGQLVGPDLQGVLDRLGSTDAIVQFMLDPAGVRPGTAMPNLGLSADEAASLAAFLGGGEAAPADTTTQPAETAPTETQAAPAGPGGTASGKNLFTGADRLANGGPPCMSCHSVAGIGALGGGQIGPDLTQVLAKYNGEQGLTSVLTQIAFPTMVPIYSGQPLTGQEAADLVAFLAAAPQAERPAGSVWRLTLLALGAIAAFAAFSLVVWRAGPLSVRRRLVTRSNLRRK